VLWYFIITSNESTGQSETLIQNNQDDSPLQRHIRPD